LVEERSFLQGEWKHSWFDMPAFTLGGGAGPQDVKLLTLYGKLYCAVRYSEPSGDVYDSIVGKYFEVRKGFGRGLTPELVKVCELFFGDGFSLRSVVWVSLLLF
jgi:hypothetical protein